MIKRTFDLVASSIGLILLAPVMLVIGVVVKRDSEGPALFKQERVGRGGKAFTLLKFRTMVSASVPSGPLVTAATDSRITRVGAKLRATKLDELPQLINVVRGDMSIVGPRPEVAKYVEMWSEEDRRLILSARPGITDPATLLLRSEQEILAQQPEPEVFYRDVLIPQKTKHYGGYVTSRSFFGDIKLILQTLEGVARVVTPRGIAPALRESLLRRLWRTRKQPHVESPTRVGVVGLSSASDALND